MGFLCHHKILLCEHILLYEIVTWNIIPSVFTSSYFFAGINNTIANILNICIWICISLKILLIYVISKRFTISPKELLS